jgi:hypothetical protein
MYNTFHCYSYTNYTSYSNLLHYFTIFECTFNNLHLWLPLNHFPSRSRSRSPSPNYFTTDGQSVSMSCYRAPLCDLCPDIPFYKQRGFPFMVPSSADVYWVRLHKQFFHRESDSLPGSKSKPKLLYHWWSVSQYVLVSGPLWDLGADIYSCRNVAVCKLQSCLHPLWREDGSAVCSAITEWFESRRTRNHTLLPVLETCHIL